jgi:hypothetical protein
MLPASSDESLGEIAPHIKNIYRVLSIQGVGLRLCDIFTGAERNLPKNMVKRLD